MQTRGMSKKNPNILQTSYVQRLVKVFVRGWEKFVPALAYLFCLALPGSCLARFDLYMAHE